MEKIYVTRPSMPSYEEYVEEIKSIWETRQLTNFGPEYEKLKTKISEKFGYEYIDLQCNGHMTLQNILACIEPGEIITTPFTFVSTALAIENTKHKAIFCDINENDYTIDANKIENLITEKTVAILAVHVFGSPCDHEALDRIAKKYNLKLIYDAAHAFGEKYKGIHIGNFGDACMFSFHATKVFNTIEGGMAVFNEQNWLDECCARSNFGFRGGTPSYSGVNSKMNEFQAAMGIVNLNHFEECIRKRKMISNMYDKELNKIDGVRLLKRKDDVEYNYSYYPIVLTENCKRTVSDLLEELSKYGIYGRRYFYPALNCLNIFSDKHETPIAKRISDNIICLPLSSDMNEEEVNLVCKVTKEYLSDE